ncbi:hypothetical protein [Nonomuraea sp. NPDC046570]|uniref:hypothetical protein n=1 Tax=Nonomuraea sp. NPDC046570 TaxID=3155255 RepID=UPI003408EEE3
MKLTHRRRPAKPQMIIIATESPLAGPFVCNTNNFILVGIANNVKHSKDRTPGAVRARFTHVVTKRPVRNNP